MKSAVIVPSNVFCLHVRAGVGGIIYYKCCCHFTDKRSGPSITFTVFIPVVHPSVCTWWVIGGEVRRVPVYLVYRVHVPGVSMAADAGGLRSESLCLSDPEWPSPPVQSEELVRQLIIVLFCRGLLCTAAGDNKNCIWPQRKFRNSGSSVTWHQLVKLIDHQII